MSLAAIRKKGYLDKLPVKKGLVKKWNRRWFVLHATSHEGVIRVEYFDNEACERSGLGKRTIPLRDCSGVSQTVGNKTRPYVFELQSQIGHHTFGCDSQPELDEWIESIKEALHEDKMKRRQRKTQSLVINRENSTDYATEDQGRKSSNTSYSEITEGTYRVTMEQNETAIKLNLQGEYNLVVNSAGLSLVGANSGASIAVWQYKLLKNYGKQHGRFHFETGKNAPTGEGRFICVTTCAKEIFGVVNRNIKRLRDAKDSERKVSLERQVEEAKASQQKIRAEKKASAVKKQSSTENPLQGQASTKRSSREIAGETTRGTYRQSKDLSEGDVLNHSSPATADQDDFDPSHIYSAVNKPKKKQGPPPKPQPYATTGASGVPKEPDNPFADIPAPILTGDANRFSFGSARDSRDSALVQLNFLGSFDEEEEPLAGGVMNPAPDESFTVPERTEDLINFDFDDLNKDFFEKLDQIDGDHVQASASVKQHEPPQKKLSQQQFDQIWDNIFSTIPSADSQVQLDS